MLLSLGIRNYRNLKSLDIEHLARVNLIAGKNNTGKTSLLEAVSLYAAEGSLSWIDELLKSRGEFYSKRATVENNRQTYAAMFYNRHEGFLDDNQIVIGPLKDVQKGFGNPLQLQESLMIRFAKMVEEMVDILEPKTNRRSTNRRWRMLEDDEESPNLYRIALSIFFKRDDSAVYILDDIDRERLIRYSYKDHRLPTYQFVRTSTSNTAASDWDRIAATDKETYVVDALRIVESNTERIVFVADPDTDERIAEVKLKNKAYRLPLKSMGDGMNRILTIILALVNASDGYLLIDEFENGLHYTVQEDLWKMIFKLAQELNVQVFATTHSDDCIHAFESVLNSEDNQKEGQYFRLEKFGAVIKPIFYSASELAVASDQNIETR